MRLPELLSEFEDLDATERLELLVELGEELPAVGPNRGTVPFPEACRVQECQTPVHLWIDVRDGKVRLEADVPRKSPTVRGLVALLVLGLQEATPQEVLELSDDLIGQLGLAEALGMTRRQGLQGMIRRIKRAVQAEQTANRAQP